MSDDEQPVEPEPPTRFEVIGGGATADDLALAVWWDAVMFGVRDAATARGGRHRAE